MGSLVSRSWFVCRREEIKKEAKSEDEDAPYRVIGMVTVHVTDSCSGHVLGVVVVSVCLSGAVLSWMCLSLSLVLCRRGVCVHPGRPFVEVAVVPPVYRIVCVSAELGQ